MSKRALILLADGFEEIEAISVIDILRRASVKVTIASLDFKLVTGAQNIMIKSDCLLEAIPEYEYDMLILPGGFSGVENLAESENVKSIIKLFQVEGKFIAAICAAPTLLEQIGVIKDKSVTSYPSVEGNLKSIKTYKTDDVVIDDKLITSRGPGTAMAFAYTLVELLLDKKTVATLKDEMVYKA